MKKPLWDPYEFERIHEPTMIGNFSFLRDVIEENQIRVLDMPIKFPNSYLELPKEVVVFKPIIEAAVTHERRVNDDFDSHYVYITIDQRPVGPGATQRREGWHSDMFFQDRSGGQIDVLAENAAFLKQKTCRIDHTYIMASRLTTEFAKIAFPLEESNCDAIEHAWDIIGRAAQLSGLTYSFKPFDLLTLTPYVVHASPTNKRDTEIDRTFVKISISEKKFNRLGNTHNDLFDYSWEMVPRSDTRNHPWA